MIDEEIRAWLELFKQQKQILEDIEKTLMKAEETLNAQK